MIDCYLCERPITEDEANELHEYDNVPSKLLGHICNDCLRKREFEALELKYGKDCEE